MTDVESHHVGRYLLPPNRSFLLSPEGCRLVCLQTDMSTSAIARWEYAQEDAMLPLPRPDGLLSACRLRRKHTHIPNLLLDTAAESIRAPHKRPIKLTQVNCRANSGHGEDSHRLHSSLRDNTISPLTRCSADAKRSRFNST
jgi:hypothetical protein